MKKPTYKLEKALEKDGHFVVGVDEVGCGCLAGPVLAVAFHLPLNAGISEIHDSKLLSAKKRVEIVEKIIKKRLKWTVGIATPQEIDRLNIRQASLLAMRRAVEAFEGATFVLVDAWTIPNLKIPQKGVIHGDQKIKSVAAASIIAKVIRDYLMAEYDLDYPGYGLGKHKGYGTKEHVSALEKLGPSAIHRMTFLKNLIKI
ncbi:MAG: ribonuclease HII [Candidatus Gracilibacteria bacterium]